MAYCAYPLSFFSDTNAEPNITGKAVEENSSDLGGSDVSPSPTSSEKGSEQFDLLDYPLEEEYHRVPQQTGEQVVSDESLRHLLNRSPFGSNGEIVMVLKY